MKFLLNLTDGRHYVQEFVTTPTGADPQAQVAALKTFAMIHDYTWVDDGWDVGYVDYGNDSEPPAQ